MKEPELKSKIALELRKQHNCFVTCLAGSQYQMPGLPDMIIITEHGIHIWVESKGPDTVTSGVQKRVHEQLRQHKAHCHILRFNLDHEWLIDDFYRVKFKTFKEGVKVLLDTLLKICEPEQLTTMEIFR